MKCLYVIRHFSKISGFCIKRKKGNPCTAFQIGKKVHPNVANEMRVRDWRLTIL